MTVEIELDDPSVLEAMLEDMAGNEQATEILEALSSAVFTGGAKWEQLTWPDEAPPITSSASDTRALSPEEALRLAERRYRHLVEQIPAITFMVVLGEGDNEIAVSPHIERVLGFTAEEWLSNPFLWYHQLHPDDRDYWHGEFARGCRTGGPWQGECRYFARDGSIKWIRGEAHLIRDERGRLQVMQGVAYDVTEARHAQEILMDRAVEQARQDEDLAIGLRVQTSLLPTRLDAPGYHAAAYMRAAEHVGGDYYDFRPVEDGVWIGIGDVSGHGLDAGLLMLMTQSAVSSLVRALPTASPSEIVVHLNEVLYDNVRDRLDQDDHVTFTLLRCAADGTMRFAGAHEDLLVFRTATKTVEQVRTQGTWLGGRRDLAAVTPDVLLELQPGDVLLLHTDGIAEAMNEAREQFGIERIAEVLGARGGDPPAAILSAIVEAVDGWMAVQDDDLTLMVVRYTG